MSQAPCSTIRAGLLGSLAGFILALLLTVVGLGTLALGLSNEFGFLPRAAGLLVRALAFFGAFGIFLMVFPPGGRLRVEVCEDTIEFQRRRGTPDVVRREEIELIVLEGSPFDGVESFSVYGPGDVRVGNWDGLVRQVHSTGPPHPEEARLPLRPAGPAVQEPALLSQPRPPTRRKLTAMSAATPEHDGAAFAIVSPTTCAPSGRASSGHGHGRSAPSPRSPHLR